MDKGRAIESFLKYGLKDGSLYTSLCTPSSDPSDVARSAVTLLRAPPSILSDSIAVSQLVDAAPAFNDERLALLEGGDLLRVTSAYGRLLSGQVLGSSAKEEVAGVCQRAVAQILTKPALLSSAPGDETSCALTTGAIAIGAAARVGCIGPEGSEFAKLVAKKWDLLQTLSVRHRAEIAVALSSLATADPSSLASCKEAVRLLMKVKGHAQTAEDRAAGLKLQESYRQLQDASSVPNSNPKRFTLKAKAKKRSSAHSAKVEPSLTTRPEGDFIVQFAEKELTDQHLYNTEIGERLCTNWSDSAEMALRICSMASSTVGHPTVSKALASAAPALTNERLLRVPPCELHQCLRTYASLLALAWSPVEKHDIADCCRRGIHIVLTQRVSQPQEVYAIGLGSAAAALAALARAAALGPEGVDFAEFVPSLPTPVLKSLPPRIRADIIVGLVIAGTINVELLPMVREAVLVLLGAGAGRINFHPLVDSESDEVCELCTAAADICGALALLWGTSEFGTMQSMQPKDIPPAASCFLNVAGDVVAHDAKSLRPRQLANLLRSYGEFRHWHEQLFPVALNVLEATSTSWMHTREALAIVAATLWGISRLQGRGFLVITCPSTALQKLSMIAAGILLKEVQSESLVLDLAAFGAALVSALCQLLAYWENEKVTTTELIKVHGTLRAAIEGWITAPLLLPQLGINHISALDEGARSLGVSERKCALLKRELAARTGAAGNQ